MKSKIIARIKGGLGNQLFCYAAARRLSIINQNELVIDYLTGFSRDVLYNRVYELSNFNIPCRLASRHEMLFPFERSRRAILKLFSRKKDLLERNYIEENKSIDLKNFCPKKNIILDGLWQNPTYFDDIENILREDLQFNIKIEDYISDIVDQIINTNSVAIHVRWFDQYNSNSGNNLSYQYYNSSILKIKELVNKPHFFVFSDDIQTTKKILNFNLDSVTYVSEYTNKLNSIYDMYLMSHCKNFILANSTFSWWSAWLCKEINPVYLIPHNQIELNGAHMWNPIDDTWKNCINH